MALLEINMNPPRAQLASFGRLWAPLFAMVISTMFWDVGLFPGCTISLSAGLLIALVGWVRPEWLKPLFVFLMLVTFPIGIVVGFVLMGFVYYLCIMPIGIILRLLGRDPLIKVFDRDTESYWIKRSDTIPVAQYFKQF